MFKYINMPKLVAFYLKEFSYDKNGDPSLLYRFIFCLCLPFVSETFYKARMTALAIAECTNSQDQIARVLKAITGATVSIVSREEEYYAAYDGSADKTDFPYDNSLETDNPIVPYRPTANVGTLIIALNGASQTEVEAYLQLLIPFYIKTEILFY